MTKGNTGGSAFPVHPDVRMDIDLQWCGMTLRDYFAAKAMQGDLVGGVHRDDFRITAKRAFIMADEMLKAREA